MTKSDPKPRAVTQRIKTPEMLLALAALITALGGPALVDAVTGRSARAHATDRKHELQTDVMAAKADQARRLMYAQVLECKRETGENRATITDLRIAVAVLEARTESAGTWSPDDPGDPISVELQPPDTWASSKRVPTYDELTDDANAEAQVQMAADFEELLHLEDELDEE
jgi:hypothetical protein